jgi:hypothetical protein
MQDHNDIYSIVERLRMLEEGLTPTNVKHGLNKQQKSVDQLSATFKPKTVAVLTAKTDPKNPMAGKLVGGCEESEELDEETLEEAITSEDVLDKVKASFADYLKNVADEIKQDTDLKDKKREDSDLKKKEKKDQDLVAKLQEHGTNLPEAVKTVAMEDGRVCEIHGDENAGFEIRHGNRSLPTRFKDLQQAEMALEMFMHRRRKPDEAQDYIDEA